MGFVVFGDYNTVNTKKGVNILMISFENFLIVCGMLVGLIGFTATANGLVGARDKKKQAQWDQYKSLEANWKKTEKLEIAIENLTKIMEDQIKITENFAARISITEERRSSMIALDMQKIASLEFILNKHAQSDAEYLAEVKRLSAAKDKVLASNGQTRV